jgi:hypothetical protein
MEVQEVVAADHLMLEVAGTSGSAGSSEVQEVVVQMDHLIKGHLDHLDQVVYQDQVLVVLMDLTSGSSGADHLIKW